MLVDGGHVTFAGGCDWRIPWVCRCKWLRVCLFGCPQQQRLRGSAATQRPLWARGLRGRGNTKNGTKAPAAKKIPTIRFCRRGRRHCWGPPGALPGNSVMDKSGALGHTGAENHPHLV